MYSSVDILVELDVSLLLTTPSFSLEIGPSRDCWIYEVLLQYLTNPTQLYRSFPTVRVQYLF